MTRFFLIPLLALLILATGCTCSVRGSASMPTEMPKASLSPAATTAPTITAEPTIAATPTETVAPVVPTEPIASPSAAATAGN